MSGIPPLTSIPYFVKEPTKLQEMPIEVLELIPPYVQTELLGARQLMDPNAMPLKDFITEVMNHPQELPRSG